MPISVRLRSTRSAGDALARVVAALRRGRGFGLREAQEPEKLCWIAAEIVQPGEERALGA